MDTTKARVVRKTSTEAERTLWKHIRFRQLNGHKFRRQAPIGRYVVDFVCFEKKLIIELDGGHHLDQSAYDSERTAWLGSQGFRVLRFWNDQVLRVIEAVKESILEALDSRQGTPHPNLPPQGGKG